MRFVQARHYGRGRRGHRVRWVVIHDMEAPERKDTAENIAAYFARTSTVASAHYNVDVNSVVQSVREGDRAWHAPPLNEESIGVEHAGYARQTKSQWRDDYSLRMLREQSAPLVADICRRHDIPVRYVDQADLRAGRAGITTHDDVSEAYGRSSHWDPGPHFPMGWYIDQVREGDDDMSWNEELAVWAPRPWDPDRERMPSGQQLNQARGYAEAAYRELRRLMYGQSIELELGGERQPRSLDYTLRHLERDQDKLVAKLDALQATNDKLVDTIGVLTGGEGWDPAAVRREIREAIESISARLVVEDEQT